MEIIKHKFETLCSTSSDINEHLPTLYKYAMECNSIFETGVRGCISSWAFVHGLLNNNNGAPKNIYMNDIDECNITELLNATLNENITVEYVWKNNLTIDFDETFDLTFIDTWHVYAQLKRELEMFSKITNKYIIMHDTTVDEWQGESIRQNMNSVQQSIETGFPIEEINRGLWPAIEEFLQNNSEWTLHERFTNNNGLTILKRNNI